MSHLRRANSLPSHTIEISNKLNIIFNFIKSVEFIKPTYLINYDETYLMIGSLSESSAATESTILTWTSNYDACFSKETSYIG